MRVCEILKRLRLGPSEGDSSDHVHEEDLERLVLEAVDENERDSIVQHIRVCEECRDRWYDARWFAFCLKRSIHGHQDSPTEERRSERRFEVHEPAKVRVLHPPAFTPVECTVVDVSHSGLRLRASKAIFSSEQVEVLVEGAAIFGVVRHCRACAENGFDIGIEIEQVELARPASIPRAGAQPASLEGPEPFDETLEILLVEDNLGDVELTRMVFQEMEIPCHLSVARDGCEALHRLQDHTQVQPGLILLDLNLPLINGFEVLERVRKEPAFHSIRVAVLSSSSADSDVARSKELGACAYLHKPAEYQLWLEVGQQIRDLVSQ